MTGPKSGEGSGSASPGERGRPRAEELGEGQLRLGVAARGDLRWAVVDLERPVEEARRRLDLSPVAAVALGRSMISAVLLLRFTTKNPGRLLFEIRGDGPLGPLLAEIDDRGDLRGLVENPHVQTPAEGVEKIGWAVGQGLLRVTQESSRGRYDSQVALHSGEIGDDLAHYLEQSQQIRSAALLGVLPRPTGVAAAGGLLIEAFPGVPEETLAHLEENLGALPGISSVLEADGISGLLDRVLAGFDIDELERHEVRYRCRCEAETLAQQLLTLASEQLTEIADENGKVTATCAFCNTRYDFSLHELLEAN